MQVNREDLQELVKEIASLKQMIEEISEVVAENNLELSDDVIQEIEEAKKAPEEDFVSHEDVLNEFCKWQK